jgi:ABC-type Fe3+-hydroxamate transport system substrate-binding protein
LYHLGAGGQVAGVTKFCVSPARARTQSGVVGGTKKPDISLIRALKPDLIIGNKEENDKETIVALRAEFPVWLSDVVTLDDCFGMIRAVGEMVQRQTQAADLERAIRQKWLELPVLSWRVAYLIWREPYMVAGPGTFIHTVLQALGLSNVAPAPRYPQVTAGWLAASGADLIVLSSEPYPFAQKHVAEIQRLAPGARVVLADGAMFSWYGSRLLEAPGYFRALFQ